MTCGYVRGGRQCGRPAVAAIRHAVDTHLADGKGYPLCREHLSFVVQDQAHDSVDRGGSMTVIEWA